MIATPPRKPKLAPAPVREPDTIVTRLVSLLAAFRYAFAGVRYLLWTQRNAKIHCAIASLVVVAGFVFRISRVDWLALVVTIALVLALEGVNTAIEAAVDLAMPQYHPLAKIAKDVAAGTVLLAAVAAVIVGMLVFMPYLWPFVSDWLGQLHAGV